MTVELTNSADEVQTVKTAKRLLGSSSKNSYDPQLDIDWDAALPEGLAWMPLERVSLYGTPLWDELSEEQRIELSKHELASIASIGLWTEIILMQMLSRDAYHRDPQDPRTHYELTEIGDETRHVIMFAKALSRMGVPTYRPPRLVHHLARLYKATARGPMLFGPVLVTEEITDRLQRSSMNDEAIHPLVRMVNRIHVVEESRHVRFAREELSRTVVRLSPVRAGLAPPGVRHGVGDPGPRARRPEGLRVGGPGPQTGASRGPRESALPGNGPLDGREDHALPRRQRHGDAGDPPDLPGRQPALAARAGPCPGSASTPATSARNCEPCCPSTSRWSNDTASWVTQRGSIARRRPTHGIRRTAPNATMPASPGLRIGVPVSTPNTPTLVIVIVPPDMSAGVVLPARAVSVSSPIARARSTQRQLVGVLDVRDDQPAVGRRGDAEVDVVLEHDLAGRRRPRSR